METTQIKEEFKQILADVMKDGVSPDEAHNSARVILQEAGKDRRTAMMNQPRASDATNGSSSHGNGEAPATDKQLAALKSFRATFKEGITKAEASELLDPLMAKVKAKNGQQ